MNTDFIEALNEIEREKGISKDILIDAIEAALISSYKRNFNTAQNVRVDINRHTGLIKVYARKTVVDEVLDPRMEISLYAAREINGNYQLNDIVEIEVTPPRFRAHCRADRQAGRDPAHSGSGARADLQCLCR